MIKINSGKNRINPLCSILLLALTFIACSEIDYNMQEVRLKKPVNDIIKLYVSEIQKTYPERYTILLFGEQLSNDTIQLVILNELTYPVDPIMCGLNPVLNLEFKVSGFNNSVYMNDSINYLIEEYGEKIIINKPENCENYLPKGYAGETWKLWIWGGQVVRFEYFYGTREVSKKTKEAVLQIRGL